MMSPLVFFVWYGLAARSTMTAHPMNSGPLVFFVWYGLAARNTWTQCGRGWSGGLLLLRM